MIAEGLETDTSIKTNITIVTSMAAAAFSLWGCSQSIPEEARDAMNDKLNKVEDKMQEANRDADTPKERVSERNDILEDLRDLRDNIDDRLAKHTEKLADKDLKAADRREHEAMKVEFEKEKGIMEGLIKNVEGATDETWATVKVGTRRTSDEVKTWWTRMKENTDRKTDADKDNDGH